MTYESKYIKNTKAIDVAKPKPSLIEWCIIIAVCLMPFTSLKGFMRIGPAELIIVAVFVTLITRKRMMIPKLFTFISKGYALFMVTCCFGLVWSIINAIINGAGMPYGTLSTVTFEFMSYVFVLMLMLTVEMLQDSDLRRLTAVQMLSYIVNISFIAMLVLFIISRSRSMLFGMPLLYYGRFSPFALNLHHTSMYLLPLTFLTVFIAERQRTILLKLMYWSMAVFIGYLALLTTSTKAEMGIYLGGFICVFYKLFTANGNKNTRIIVLSLIALAGLFVFISLNLQKVWSFVLDYFHDNDNGDARQNLWSRGIDIWKSSPLVGWGFGVRIPDQWGVYWDAHNSFLSVMLGGGLLGLGVFLMMWVLVFQQSIFNGYILATNVSIFIYTSGGDVLRRIPIWFFLIFSLYIIREIKEEREVISHPSSVSSCINLRR